MKLLFDANLSRRLITKLKDVYAGSMHAASLGPDPDDTVIWDHARIHGYMIVSKDSDFYGMSTARGAPPKVVWLRIGNAGSVEIAAQLRLRFGDLAQFEADPTAALMILGQQA